MKLQLLLLALLTLLSQAVENSFVVKDTTFEDRTGLKEGERLEFTKEPRPVIDKHPVSQEEIPNGDRPPTPAQTSPQSSALGDAWKWSSKKASSVWNWWNQSAWPATKNAGNRLWNWTKNTAWPATRTAGGKAVDWTKNTAWPAPKTAGGKAAGTVQDWWSRSKWGKPKAD